jgi:subtilisin-like proprotein convertase family protein
VCFLAAGSVLFIVSGLARGSGTALVYTYGGSFNLAIPANPAETRGWMQDAVVFVPSHILIVDVDVLVNVRHTSAFDLKISLQSPSGRRVDLAAGEPLEGFFRGPDFSGTQFDDEAIARIEDASPPFAGPLRPCQPLAAFDGRDAYGAWSLLIYDAHYGDVGRLESFVLTITGSLTQGGVTVPSPPAGFLAILGVAALRSAGRRRTDFRRAE